MSVSVFLNPLMAGSKLPELSWDTARQSNHTYLRNSVLPAVLTQQAEVVIAEITPANPNVFYEVGYAHALGKPTILLAQRGAELPFDIRSFRVVFYNDTIGGKAEVERNLSKHLEAITGR